MKQFSLLSDKDLSDVSGGTFGPGEHTIEVTKANFDSVIHSAKNVVIFIGASWCGPCSLMSKNIDQFSASHESIVIGTLDVDKSGNDVLLGKLGVQSIPTNLYYKDGVLVDRTMGVVPIDRMEKAFQ